VPRGLTKPGLSQDDKLSPVARDAALQLGDNRSVDEVITDAGWREIQRIISDLSEEAYSAGWMQEAEYDVWRLSTEGGSWGHLTAAEAEPQLRQLLQLVGSSGYWVMWDGSSEEERPVRLQDWYSRYRTWRNALNPNDIR